MGSSTNRSIAGNAIAKHFLTRKKNAGTASDLPWGVVLRTPKTHPRGTAMEEMDNRVKARLHKMVWMAIYGDLIGPCANLVIHANRNCPPNYKAAMLRAVGCVVTLLKIKLDKKPNQPEITGGT